MSPYICKSCLASLRHAFSPRYLFPSSKRAYGVVPSKEHAKVDCAALLSQPTWSVKSLFNSENVPIPAEDQITPAKLHHLLRLSALPLPASSEEEASMLSTLHSQLHFVRNIQKVDTQGIEPLVCIRDETEGGIKDITIGLDSLREALDKEDVKGRSKRPRRRRGEHVDTKGVEGWDVFSTAGESIQVPGGRFFVVRSGKGRPETHSPASCLPKTTGTCSQTLLLDDTSRGI